jgi:hypothetical protein
MKTLEQAFANGLEDVSKYCLRYGQIVEDSSASYVKGHWRRYVISIDGKQVLLIKENGWTTGAMIL